MAFTDPFALLGQRRFGPFFWTQFAGAANDNLFKFALTVLVTYQVQVAWLPPAMAGLVIGALFILPFVLFSASSGQLADKYEKAALMRRTKDLELLIMALAAWGLLAEQLPLLLACIFLMGLQSTLFGPVKFAYLPQHLSPAELTGGNGMVEMGTFVAILLGNLAGGLLIDGPQGPLAVAGACLVVAALGRWSAQRVPSSPAADPGLRIRWNPLSETWRNLQQARGDAVVFRSLLGISWMWFYGAVLLSQFPALAKEVLRGDAGVASLLLAVFSVGIGLGALLCEQLSRKQVEIGLVPLGAIGMSVFGIDLYLATRGFAPGPGPLRDVAGFLATPGGWRVLADLALLAAATGLYSVPMYALIQLRSPPSHRARIIAANNILNALFMVASSLLAGALLAAGASLQELILATALLNALVAGAVFVCVPDYLLRLAVLVAARPVHRLRVEGAEALPATGPALLRVPALGPLGPLLLQALGPRPVRCLVDEAALARPLLGRLLRLAGALDGRRIDDRLRDEAALHAALAQGELVAVFEADAAAAAVCESAAADLPVFRLRRLGAGPAAGPARLGERIGLQVESCASPGPHAGLAD
ncbi:MFS transporter [Aquariibacter lacus]|uniref:MFS transporter n=1 Tax=Aquariibacter lacus TaxID=2801332 RepID=UPI0033072315